MSVTIVCFTAEPLEKNGPADSGHHQLKAGNILISITPETARQWLPIITEIAEEEPRV